MRAEAPLPPPEPRTHLSEGQRRRIAELIYRRAGIVLAEGSEKLVVSRLSKHLRRLGCDGFDAYLARVTGPDGEGELDQMVDALTTNTTRFFREPEHFRILERELMPRLVREARAGRRVRIWSAACSSGEEPYSIASIVLAQLPEAARLDLRILATDINRAVLRTAEAGRYDASARRSLTEPQAEQMFEPEGAAEPRRIRRALRELVTFRYMNFMEPWPVSGPFDAIFCRNVAIYMDRATQARIWAGLERVLDARGMLFIGHSERIGPELSDRLQLFGPTSFRRPAAPRDPAHPLP